MDSLDQIMAKYGSDKTNQTFGWHNYSEFYERLFEHLRGEPLNIGEVGIGTVNPDIPASMARFGAAGFPAFKTYRPGASIYAWREYFCRAEVFAFDIDHEILIQAERITSRWMDMRDPASVKRALAATGVQFDIFIDDGLHDEQANASLLRGAIEYMKPGGIYVVEDVADDNRLLDPSQLFARSPIDRVREFEVFRLPHERNHEDNNLLVIRVA